MQRVLQKQKNLKPGWGGILTEGFFAVRGPHSNCGGGIFGIRGGILTFILTVYISFGFQTGYTIGPMRLLSHIDLKI